MKKIVLLLNIGGIYSPDEAETFLRNMFYDENILTIKKPFLRKLLASLIIKLRLPKTKKIYEKAENSSRILPLSQSLVSKLNAQESEFFFDFAFNYSQPYLNEVLEKYLQAEELILFPLFPHFSTTTVASLLESSNSYLQEQNFQGKVKIIQPFYKDEAYNKIILDEIKQNFDEERTLLFSAHSLPEKIIKKGDPYLDENLEHFELLKENLLKENYNFKAFLLTFQSKLGPIKWLEPSTSESLQKLENKKVLIYPLSFCIDNSETDYELNKTYKNLASSLNYEYYKVLPAPNDSENFVKYILEKVKLAKWEIIFYLSFKKI